MLWQQIHQEYQVLHRLIVGKLDFAVTTNQISRLYIA